MVKVSIIIPLYNVAKYIVQCCNSILADSYSCKEVIFVDDCGTDSTMSILKDYLAKHQDFPEYRIYRHTHNRGLSAARNTGLAQAMGDYVYFLDSDDELSKDAIAILAEHANTDNYDVIVGSFEEIDDKGMRIDKLILRDGPVESAKNAYAKGEWYVMAWNKLCRRDFLGKHLLWFEEGLLHEDMPWSLKLACNNPKMYLESTITYQYRIRQSSIMTSMSVEKDILIHIEVFQRMKSYIDIWRLHFDPDVYTVVEGKKCQLLYSLLERGDYALYNKYFGELKSTGFVNPYKAYRNGTISLPYLVRDFGNCLPDGLGKAYKRLFYNIMYGWRKRKIEGALWK